MEETEDEMDTNLILSSTKKPKLKISKNNYILRKVKYQSKEKFQMDSIQKIFNQGITSNQPVKMIFTSNNTVKPLPILSNVSKNNNDDDYLIINEEMKINKNIIENNLFNLMHKEHNKKKLANRNLFSSFIRDNSMNLLKNEKDDKKDKEEKDYKDYKDEKEQDSVGTEDQKSVESYSGKGKGATSPSSVGDIKKKNTSLIHRNIKKYKNKSLSKIHKKKISLIKMLNKPFCFISSKSKKDKNNNFMSDEVRNFSINRNLFISGEQKTNDRYNNISVINNKNLERVTFYKVNHIYNERVRSGLIRVRASTQNKKIDLQLSKNNSVKNFVKYNDILGCDSQSSLYEFKLNLLRNKISKQTSQFSIYHFIKSHNIYIFIKNSKYSSKHNIKNLTGTYFNIKNTAPINPKTFSNQKLYEIEEDFYLPGAYRPRMNKWQKMPDCILNTCKRGGIELIKNMENCNIIWKLIHPNKMRELIRIINRPQKYNHFPCTFQLGRKDNLYRHIKAYKRLFPKLYNFVPATYIIPIDMKDFEIVFKKYKKALWIIKPVNLSRGRGVHILKGEPELKFLFKRYKAITLPPNILISRYIDKPHLINKKKYDLRIYVLIISFYPLRIYLYNNGLTRFATEDYKRGDFDNVFIHLTNYSINKNNLKYKPNQNLTNFDFHKNNNNSNNINKNISVEENEENEDYDEDYDFVEDYSKWSLIELRHYFKKMGKEKIMDKIWKQVQDIIIKTILSVADDYYKEISINKIHNLFELYGFDIMIDEKFKAWLIEVNINPSLHCTSPLDLNLKTDLITDILNVVGISPYNHNNNGETIFNYLMKKTKIDFDINNDMFPKLRFTKNNFFDLYNDFDNYVNNNKNNCLNNNIPFRSFNNSNNLISIKSNIMKNFNPMNLRQKIPEYDNEYYKNIIEYFVEERARSEMTDFSLIFPLKNNIENYSNIMVKSNTLNDANIVLWQHILTEKYNYDSTKINYI